MKNACSIIYSWYTIFYFKGCSVIYSYFFLNQLHLNKISKQVPILHIEAYSGMVFSEFKRLKLWNRSRPFKEIVRISGMRKLWRMSCYLVHFLSKPHVVQQPLTMICEIKQNEPRPSCPEDVKWLTRISNLVVNIEFIPGWQGFIFDTRTCYLHVIYNVLSRALESEHKKGKANEKCSLHHRVFSTDRDLFLRKI